MGGVLTVCEQCSRVRACVSAWLPFNTGVCGGLARPHWPTWQLSSGYLVWGAVVHMTAERGRLFKPMTFQPSLSAPDGRYSLLPASSILPLPIGCSALRASQRHRHQQQQLLLCPWWNCRSNPHSLCPPWVSSWVPLRMCEVHEVSKYWWCMHCDDASCSWNRISAATPALAH